MPPSYFDDALNTQLERRRMSNLWRRREIVEPIDATHVRIEGCVYVNFCSNNYLGLTHHPAVVASVIAATEKYGAGAGSASLITGYTPLHTAAELSLAEWKSTEAAVLFPSGYQANQAAVQTLLALGEAHTGGIRFLIDKLAHASLIDAVRATGTRWRVFPHNGFRKLSRLLEEADPAELQVVITESIFSMDGDAAGLKELAVIKEKHPFFLLLDEAHASGVYGNFGQGYAAELGLADKVDATVVTLSKAMGAAGGAICASRNFCDALVNFGRAYIYSTGVPASMAAAAQAAIDVMKNEPQRQSRARELATKVRSQLAPWLSTGKSTENTPVDSPIIPIILGNEQAALQAAKEMRNQGLLTIAVRPPTVALGSSRLRITLSSQHTDAEVDRLLDELKRILPNTR